MWRSLGLMLLTLGVVPVAGAIEEPAFKLLLKDGDHEVRQYAPTVVAEVVVGGDLETASSRGFRLVAGYIFGGNRAVSAVSAEPGSERIAMTAPVVAVPEDRQNLEGANRWRVQFVMPSKYTLATLPRPNNPAVALRELPGQRTAVLRFSGFMNEAKVEGKAQELLAWLKARGMRAVGPPRLLRYDPPWTLPFMRRHEVVFDVEAKD
jgi:hypothetical protein